MSAFRYLIWSCGVMLASLYFIPRILFLELDELYGDSLLPTVRESNVSLLE